MSTDYRAFVTLVESWQFQKREVFKRHEYADGSNAASLREFVEIQNGITRRLISELQKQDPQFWESLMELSVNAARMIEKGKVFVDKQDVTQAGM